MSLPARELIPRHCWTLSRSSRLLGQGSPPSPSKTARCPKHPEFQILWNSWQADKRGWKLASLWDVFEARFNIGSLFSILGNTIGNSLPKERYAWDSNLLGIHRFWVAGQEKDIMVNMMAQLILAPIENSLFFLLVTSDKWQVTSDYLCVNCVWVWFKRRLHTTRFHTAPVYRVEPGVDFYLGIQNWRCLPHLML